jgi:hypothetical protein
MVERFALRSTNLLILFGIRRNCLRSGGIDKADCSNYRGILIFQTTYKILSSILLLRLTPYAEEIIGVHHWGLRRGRSTTDHIFCIDKYLVKKGNKKKQYFSYVKIRESL